MKNNFLKQKLQAGETVYGPFCKIQDPALIEIAALAGFDFVIIDMEHGPFSIGNVQQMIRAAEARGICPVVRVTENRETLLLRTLDIGARCVQVPQVSTTENANEVVRGTRFYPKGERGMCRYVRAADYSSISGQEHFGNANDAIVTIIHIEGLEGIKNLPAILETEGIDVIFLGPYDLSQSCGVPGQVQHKLVIEKMQEAVRLARAAGKAVGTFVESVEDARKWKEIGVQYIAYSVDVGLIMNTFSSITSGLRA